MKSSVKKRKFVNIFLHIIGFILCTVPPILCTISYFPLWKSTGYESCIAGGTALLIAVCAVPIYKAIKRYFSSPSASFMWLIIFLIFFTLSKIADEMTVIAFSGFVGNLLGSLCFRITKAGGSKREV